MGYCGVRNGKGGARNVIMFVLRFADFEKYSVFAVYLLFNHCQSHRENSSRVRAQESGYFKIR
jgi:hypothetical protein